jgi:imidazolonepropionase-like amidohydrolase
MVPWLRAVLPNADPDAIVEEALRAGVTGVKMTSGLDTGMVHRLSDRAHAAGLMVWTHAAVHPGRPRDAVMAGADVISHSPLLAWEIPKVNWPGEIDAASWLTACGEVVRTPAPIDALFTMMRERGTLLEPTLLTYHRGAEARRDTGRLEACSKWLAARAHAAGIPLVAGTDTFVSLGGRAMLHDEMRRLVLDAGLTPREALAAATCNAARALGRAGHVGRIAIGMEADLVLLAADPTVDIDNTRRVVAVIKQGRLFLVRPGTEPAPH